MGLGGLAMGSSMDPIRFSITSWVAAALTALNFTSALRFLKETHVHPSSAPIASQQAGVKGEMEKPLMDQNPATKPPSMCDVIRNPQLFAVLISVLLSNFAFTLYEVAFPIFMNDSFNLKADFIGYAFATFGVVFAGSQLLMTGPIIGRFGEMWTVVVGSLLRGCAFAGMGVMGSWVYSATSEYRAYAVLANVFAMGLFGALNQPCFLSMASLLTPPGMQGATMGLYQVMVAAARSIGPLTSGALYDYNKGTYDGTLPFYVAGASMALVALMVLIVDPKRGCCAVPPKEPPPGIEPAAPDQGLLRASCESLQDEPDRRSYTIAVPPSVVVGRPEFVA